MHDLQETIWFPISRKYVAPPLTRHRFSQELTSPANCMFEMEKAILRSRFAYSRVLQREQHIFILCLICRLVRFSLPYISLPTVMTSDNETTYQSAAAELKLLFNHQHSNKSLVDKAKWDVYPKTSSKRCNRY